jgi:hypothetical protein
MPQMGYDTKTDRLTDCQSQCDFDSAIDTDQSRPVLNQSRPVTTSYQSLLHLRVNNTATCPAIAGRQEARLLAEPARALPAGANLRSASFTSATTSLYQQRQEPISSSHIQHAPPRITRPPQRTGNSTQISSADYQLAARWTQPVAVRAAREICPTHYGPFRGHHPPFQPTSADHLEDLHTPSKTAPFRAIDSSSAGIVLSAP